jgi:hypothetical protein
MTRALRRRRALIHTPRRKPWRSDLNVRKRWLSLSIFSLVLGLSAPASAQTTYLVHLQAQSGHYVVAENGGWGDQLYANRTSPGDWETFNLIETSDSNGDLITGDEIRWEVAYNGRDVIATTTWPYGPGYPICGGSTVTTSSSGQPNCRKFYIYKTNNAGDILWGEAIQNGDQVAIDTYDGALIQAVGGGGGDLNANGGGVGPWEKFFITIISKGS